ncbi:YitT family protein [Kocuria palustris]|uniref:YczE/YyaS/YitT family protein n=1 Tax=Kocuria palustris TaxID=71999 RepID=UPI001C92CA72|nr:DUF6198 family protein [Kocuria palustris]
MKSSEPPARPAMPAPEFGLPVRWLLFAAGVGIMSVGIAVSVHAALGTSPISTVPAALAGPLPLSFGRITILMNLVFVAVQAILLRRRFHPINILQIAVAVIFGWLCDVSLRLTGFLQPADYLQQWLLVILGAVLVSIGVFIQVLPRILYIPGEGIVAAIATVSGWQFGTVKQCFDWFLVILAVILSLWLSGELQGVREGTVFAAFVVGGLVKTYQRWWNRIRARRRPDSR